METQYVWNSKFGGGYFHAESDNDALARAKNIPGIVVLFVAATNKQRHHSEKDRIVWGAVATKSFS